jgi:hypothetical protein
MKTNIFALCFALIAAGCGPQTHYVHLRKSPSSLLMVNVKSDGARSVAYAFESKVPDAFRFKDILIDLNASYASNLTHYMEHKYMVVKADGAANKVTVSLESCEIETADAGTETVGVGFATVVVQRLTVTTTLKVNVRVESGGRVFEDEIIATGEYTGEINSLSTGQMSITLALEGNILLLDRFLNNVFGVSGGSAGEPESAPAGGISDI